MQSHARNANIGFVVVPKSDDAGYAGGLRRRRQLAEKRRVAIDDGMATWHHAAEYFSLGIGNLGE